MCKLCHKQFKLIYWVVHFLKTLIKLEKKVNSKFEEEKSRCMDFSEPLL